MSEFKKNVVWLLIFAAIATVQVLIWLIVLSYWIDDQVLGGYVTYGTYATFFIPFVLKLWWNQWTKIWFVLFLFVFLLIFMTELPLIILSTGLRYLDRSIIIVAWATFVIVTSIIIGARLLEPHGEPMPHPFNRDTFKTMTVMIFLIVISIALPAVWGGYGATAMVCVWIWASIWSIKDLWGKVWRSVIMKMSWMGGMIFIFVNGIVFEIIAFVRESEMPIPREALMQFEFLYVLMVIHIAFVCGEIYSNAKLKEQWKSRLSAY